MTEPFGRDYLFRLMTTSPNAFWRFDCDVALEAAARMARFVQVTGVRATFFVLAVGDWYNPLSIASRRAIEAIRSADQDVALHADYRGPGSVPAEVARQRALLDHAGLPLNSDVVAFHMPPLVVLWRDFPEFDSAYATKWRGRYVSDSRRRWSPAKALAVNDRAQVCLHPEHWDV
jgi:hypothetical protein